MAAGTRARARAERQRLAARAAAERQAAAAVAARRRARIARLTGPWRRAGRGRQTGALATRRRTQTRLLLAVLIVVNVLVWFLDPSWAARAFALVATVLVAPVLHTLLFRKA